MKKALIYLLLLPFLLFSKLYAQNSPGDPDLTFNSGGKVIYDLDYFDIYQDVKVQPDGKIVAAGMSMGADYVPYVVVNRFLESGQPDESFGTHGQYIYNTGVENGAYKCLILSDGRILIGGYSTDYTNWQMLIICLNEDGSPDPSFGDQGVSHLQMGVGETVLSAMATDKNGNILVAGYTTNDLYLKVPVVARLTESGSIDPDFGTDGYSYVPVTEIENEFSAVCVQNDNKILAAGHISNGSNWFSLLITRFNPDGTIDSIYGTDGMVNLNLNNVDDEFFDMALTEYGESVLTGFTVDQSDYSYHLLVMKFDTSGIPVPTFGDQGKVISGDTPYTFGDALMLQTDGKIVIAGCTGMLLPEDNDWALWRLNPNGTFDDSFGNNGLTTTDFFGNPDEALGIALYNDNILLAGKTRNAENRLDFAIARYLNDTEYHLSVNDWHNTENIKLYPDPVQKNGILSIEVDNSKARDIKVELYDITNRCMILLPSKKYPSGKQNLRIVIPASLSEGLYSLRIESNAGTIYSGKLVILN